MHTTGKALSSNVDARLVRAFAEHRCVKYNLQRLLLYMHLYVLYKKITRVLLFSQKIYGPGIIY